MRGRRPKPSALKVQDISHRRPNEREPQPTPGAPDPLEWLSAAAREEWLRVSPELERMGLLTRVDMAALAAYAQSYAHYVEAERLIREHGLTVAIRDDKGILKSVLPVPEVNISLKMLDKIRAFAGEFGFTPSARSRIEIPMSNREELRDQIKREIEQLEATAKKA